jgi:hypothetical protein
MCVVEIRNGKQILAGNLQGKRAFERNDRKLEGNITILKWILTL